MIRVGAHVSIAGGITKAIDRAKEAGCNAFQIFVKNPRSLILQKPIEKNEVDLFVSRAKEEDMHPVVVHANYLINLASTDDEKLEASISSLCEEVSKADCIGAKYIVVHPGHAKEQPMSEALKVVASSIDKVVERTNPKVVICLENMAGMGTEVGGKFEDHARIIECSKYKDNLGICLDTCHAHAASFDLSTDVGISDLFSNIQSTVGLSRIKVIHVNDSKFPFGLKKDRHANIGKGTIGIQGFSHIARIKELVDAVFILETPEDEPDAHKKDVMLIRSILEGSN